jgi:hypothetical protein
LPTWVCASAGPQGKPKDMPKVRLTIACGTT